MFALIRPSGQIVAESVAPTKSGAEQKRNRIANPKFCTVEPVLVMLEQEYSFPKKDSLWAKPDVQPESDNKE